MLQGRPAIILRNLALQMPLRICALVGQFQDPRVAECAQALIPVLLARQLTVLAPEGGASGPVPPGAQASGLPELVGRAQLVIAIGGDGTLLYAAGLVAESGIPLLGINRGRLGFLTDVMPQDMVSCIDAV